MPHVNIQYSANLGAEAAMDALCFNLAEVLVAQRDASGARCSRSAARVFSPIPRRISQSPTARATAPSCTCRCGSRRAASATLVKPPPARP